MMETWQPWAARIPGVVQVLFRSSNLVAWVSDGMRLNGDQTRRESLNDHLMHMYEEFGFKDKMLVIRGDYNQRLTAAINVVDNMLNLPQK